MTHHLPIAADYFRETKPKWFTEAHLKIEAVKSIFGGDWGKWENVQRRSILPLFTHKVTVEQMPQSENEEFADYMVGNSLVLKKVAASQ